MNVLLLKGDNDVDNIKNGKGREGNVVRGECMGLVEKVKGRKGKKRGFVERRGRKKGEKEMRKKGKEKE